MGETVNLLFHSRQDGTYELRVKESWSGRTVNGSFVPPYTGRQFNALQKKLNDLDSSDAVLREVGQRLFASLCGVGVADINQGAAEQPVQTVLRGIIQRTLKRRGTVALSLGFGPGCDEFVRYPWELLHNGDHFLLVSGIFTLSRVLLRPDIPVGCELPVHPPFRVLYIASSPTDCAPLETERSFEAMEQALTPLIEDGQIFLDRLEPPTFGQLVRYLNSYGGASMLDDSDTTVPCYVVQFDGHGAYGRLCPNEHCETVNDSNVAKCIACGTALGRSKPQTYLCFCDDDGTNRFIDTQSLRGLFLSSDVRLAVFSACETATVTVKNTPRQQQRHAAVDATLATALVTAQVPAVVAMPFSLQDDLSPTFMYHFYEALADGRTLEEALARARQALLPMQQKSWFIPVLYRHVAEGEEGPVALFAAHDDLGQHGHPLAHLGPPANFIGRAQELQDMDELLTSAATGARKANQMSQMQPRSGGQYTHHIAITGSAGIGKSALALETVRRNREKFPGGIVGVSVQDGKSFADALLELMRFLRVPVRNMSATDVPYRVRLVQGTLRSLASRELPCLLLVDSFEEVKDRAELEAWLQFLCALPQEVVVLVTSRSNPEHMLAVEGTHCRWYEYRVGKMVGSDLLDLFNDLAAATGLDQRIHLDDPQQQQVLRDICALLDGYPLGAELIFGTARSIGGKIYTPEAATRSLEEVRDELRETPLAGILAALEVSYRRLHPAARLLLAYLAAFTLPFSREQILMVVTAGAPSPASLERHHSAASMDVQVSFDHDEHDEHVAAELAANWRAARDELVQASFIQFDGRMYTIYPQIGHFALTHLLLPEHRRVQRVLAASYCNVAQPGLEQWLAAFEHLETAGEPQDLQEAVRIAIRAAQLLGRHGYAPALQMMLRRAAMHASRLGDRTGEGQLQRCLGASLRQLGNYAEAEACLRSSVTFHRQQHEDEHVGWALYELATLFAEEGDFAQASTYALEALTLFQEADNKQGEAWIHIVIGGVGYGNAHYYEALGHFETALTYFQPMREQEGLSAAWRGRGTVYEALGQYTRALRDYENALRLCTELDLFSGYAWTLVGRSVVYTDLAHFDLAEKDCEDALARFRKQGLRRGEGWALRVRGDIAYKQHAIGDACTYYEEAHTLCSTIGDRVNLAATLYALGTIALEEGEYLEAKGLFEQARALASEQGARRMDGQAQCGLGDVAQVLQLSGDAEHYYRQALTIANELDVPVERVAVLQRLGMLFVAQKKYAQALDFWVHALLLDQRLGHLTHNELQAKVNMLVSEQHLEEAYRELCGQVGDA